MNSRDGKHTPSSNTTPEETAQARGVTVDVVDDVEVCALQLLLEAVKVLTIALQVLHLRNDVQVAHASATCMSQTRSPISIVVTMFQKPKVLHLPWTNSRQILHQILRAIAG
jgi:hypothetical protein